MIQPTNLTNISEAENEESMLDNPILTAEQDKDLEIWDQEFPEKKDNVIVIEEYKKPDVSNQNIFE